MKSKRNKTKIDKLNLCWDEKASRLSQTQSIKKIESGKNVNFELYFNFLEELKPHERELRKTKLFDKPFTLD